VTNLYVLVANMVNVSCLGCVPVILDGLDGTAVFAKSEPTANTAGVSTNPLSAIATASTMDQLVINQCAKKVVTLNMATAKSPSSVGAGQAGLVKIALNVNPIGTASMELVLMTHGSASVMMDGLDLIAIAQSTLMEIGGNGEHGASAR